MSADAKKWLNRGGLIAVALGIIGIVAGGGDTGAALELGGTVASIAGAIVLIIKEIIQSREL
jgi:hypothetical protein